MAVKDISDFKVCQHVIKYKSVVGVPFPYETLAIETGQPEKVCYRAMERANKRGLIAYGVSLRTGWLTEKGLELLNKETP